MTLLLLVLACLTPPEFVDDTSADAGEDACSALAGEGQRARRLDASDDALWTYLELEGGALLDVDAPESDPSWHIGARRASLKLNGGVSGPGGLEAAFVPEQSVDTLEAPPADGWASDAPDADGDGAPEYALGGWYDYDITTHVLTPKAGVYALRAPTGATWALEVLDYYDDAGSGGYPCLRWAALGD